MNALKVDNKKWANKVISVLLDNNVNFSVTIQYPSNIARALIFFDAHGRSNRIIPTEANWEQVKTYLLDKTVGWKDAR